MSIEKMSLINIVGSISSLDEALLLCCESNLFHPELAAVDGSGNIFRASKEENPYSDYLQQVQDLMTLLRLTPQYADYSALSFTDEECQQYLKKHIDQIQQIASKEKEIAENLSLHKQVLAQLEHLSGLDLKFDELRHSRHSTARFGRLPSDSYLKLSYFSRKNFFFFDFDHDDDYYWGMYFAPNAQLEEIDALFDSLYFERIEIPDYAHDTPRLAAQDMRKKIADEESAIANMESQILDEQQKQRDTVLQIYSKMKVKHDTFDYRKYAAVSDSQFYLEGFVPKRKVSKFLKLFEDLETVVCEEQPVDADARLTPPVKLKTNWFFKPFEMFVDMYGLPGYYDVNPTSFIGFIYVLLFGIMFGDLGQGAVLALGGLLVWKKKRMQLAAIVSRCGISSMIFGTLYGSVFGFENLLDPMFQWFGFAEKPIDVFKPQTTNMLLICVVGIGMVVVISSILLNIYLKWKRKDYEQAVFGNNGIAGLIFYGGVILAAVLLLLSGINLLNPVFILVVIVLPILLMMFREPLGKLAAGKKKVKLEGGVGGFIMQNFFELFEFLLSYITNTLSFLRVGGFVLSHAGMMAVVMTLAEMVGTAGSPVVIVLGNLFVMGLEGLLVGIQVLRLVFYETFSRFYEGEGKPFVPAGVHFEDQK